jgi:hypothetical protein
MSVLNGVCFLIMALLGTGSFSYAQSCILRCPDNIVVKADSGKGGTAVNFPVPSTTGNCGTVSFTPATGSFFRIGSNSVVAKTSSGQKCSFTITITDNEPPVLTALVLSPTRLWPATNQMKEVAVHYSVTDNAEEAACKLTISCNDPQASGQDWQIVNPHLLWLKAKRKANGQARIYILTVACTDAAGNTTKRSTAIAVSEVIKK